MFFQNVRHCCLYIFSSVYKEVPEWKVPYGTDFPVVFEPEFPRLFQHLETKT